MLSAFQSFAAQTISSLLAMIIPLSTQCDLTQKGSFLIEPTILRVIINNNSIPWLQIIVSIYICLFCGLFRLIIRVVFVLEEREATGLNSLTGGINDPPRYSMPVLIECAILGSPEQKLTYGELRITLKTRFRHFQREEDEGSKSWEVSKQLPKERKIPKVVVAGFSSRRLLDRESQCASLQP